jgi:hypothetical protein
VPTSRSTKRTKNKSSGGLLRGVAPFRASRALVISLGLVVAGAVTWAVLAASTIQPPKQLSPVANASVPAGNVTFSWAPVTGALSYRVSIAKATDTQFQSPVFLRTESVTSISTTLANGSYIWRVRSRDTNGGGPWSAVTTLTVGSGVATATPTPTATPSPTPKPAVAGSWWQPTAAAPIAFHWVLGDALNVNDPKQMGLRDFSGNVLPAPAVYDIDGEYNTAATVSYLHNQGKKVVCYFDAGVYETYRSDAYKFQALSPQVWGSADAGWDGSYWLDIRRINDLAPIMKARMQMCKDKGFDAIEPDEIDGWENSSGFPLTYQDQINYNKAVAQWAHDLGMSIGQKGDLIQTRDLVGSFDWTLNEECYQYSECTNPYDPVLKKNVPGLQLYVQANKAVFVAEYKSYTASKWTSICTDSATNHFNTTRFKLGLPNNGGRMPCPTTSATIW